MERIAIISDRIVLYSFYISCVALFIAASLTTINAISRYLLNYPIPGIIEFTTHYLMVAMVFFSLAYIHKHDGNVYIKIIFDDLGEEAQLAIRLFSNSLILVIFLLIARSSIIRAAELTASNATMVARVPWPTYIPWWIVSFGLILFCVVLLEDIIDSGSKLSDKIIH